MAKEETIPDPRDQIVQTLRAKSGMKQDVHKRTVELFELLKTTLSAVAEDLSNGVKEYDERLTIAYTDKGAMACELKAAGDLIIFHMHTNVFKLDQSNNLWKSSYLEEDEMRGYFGLINVYNFLNDSFKFNREGDIGYLVARIFLNKEGHFFVQGKKQLGFLYNDLQGSVLDAEKLKAVIQSVIQHVLEFDLLAPPYDQVSQVSVSEMNELNANVQVVTGKRLGFRFLADVVGAE